MASGIDPNLPQLPYIVTDLFVAMNHSHGLDAVNYHTLQLFSLLAHVTRDDEDFQEEWGRIQEARKGQEAKGYRQGQDGFEDYDLGFRMQERTALSSAAQRNGVISRLPTPKTTWKPEIKA